MAENRPHRPFAAHVDIMQRSFLVQAGVCGIRVLQNIVAENNFFARRNNLHLLKRLELPNPESWLFIEVESSILRSALIRKRREDAAKSIQRFGFFPSLASAA